MHIALDMTNLSFGGSISILLRYMREWLKCGGCRLTVYYSRDIIRQEIERSGLNVELICVGAGYPAWRIFLFRSFRLGRLIQAHGAEVVYCVNSMLLLCALPQVVHMRNLQHFTEPSLLSQLLHRGPYEFMRDWICRYSVRHADACVYVSHYLRQMAAPWIPHDRSRRHHVVPNPIPDDVADSAARASSGSFTGSEILTVANDYPHKDIGTLLRTLAILRRRDPGRDWRLTILGQGKWQEHYGELLTALSLRDRVSFGGYVSASDIAEFYRRAFCLVSTSVLEAFNNTLLEAMTHGIPAVVSDCCAHPEIVGRAGILVEPGNPEAFAGAILDLAASPESYRERVRLGREHVKGFFAAESADRFLEVVRRVVAGKD